GGAGFVGLSTMTRTSRSCGFALGERFGRPGSRFVITAVIRGTNSSSRHDRSVTKKPCVSRAFSMRPRGLEPPPGKKPDKALNLVRRVIELTISSICRDLSAGADDLDAYGE